MNHWSDFEHDLDPELPERDRQSLARVAALLSADRPVPSAGFRGRLRRELVADSPKPMWRPRRLRLTVTAYAASGLTLLVLAGVGVLGAGPFAAGHQSGSQASAGAAQAPSGR